MSYNKLDIFILFAYICTMKKKLPHILNFDDLWDQYSIAELYDPSGEFLWKEKIGLTTDKHGESYRNSTKSIGEEKRKKVLDTIAKYKNEIGDIEDVMLEFVQHQVILNPKVYIARTKDIKTEIEYFTAKTFFPLKGGKRKEVKIYIGKAEDYDNDTKNKNAIDWAQIKMQQTLSRRLKEGSL